MVVERLLRRERFILLSGMGALTLLCWTYLLMGAGTGMSPAAMTTWRFPPDVPLSTAAGTWDGACWLVMVLMWWVMMIAMMTPAAAPVILLHARVTRHAQCQGRSSGGVVPAGAFLAGYLAIWLAFSLAATLLQWSLERAGLIDGMLMWSTSRDLTAVLLLAAGAYQLSPFKTACLGHCRSPVEWLARHSHAGRRGAFRMGLAHGTYCLGCCWTLMLLLFAGGVMNVLWIGGLSILVLAEKALPFSAWLTRGAAAVLVTAGVALLVT